MQIILTGVGLWLAVLLAVARLIWMTISPERGRRVWRLLCLWALMSASAVALYFRPHEDIFGGEDPGAYINSGVTYAREMMFYHVDPMLATVAPELRPLFYFGHAGYGATKDACLWVSNRQMALVGPHFQPAYPLMIAAAVRLLNTPRAALYVVPLFAVFTALALAALAGLLLRPRRWAGVLAFWIFLLVPLTIWHGRMPRPELIAAFMLFAASAMLANAAIGMKRRRGDVWLGGMCLMLAPFFHVTAWFAVAPALALMMIFIGAGRRDFMPVMLIAALALWALNIQSLYVTDYYGLGHILREALAHPAGWAALSASVVSALIVGRVSRRLVIGARRNGWGVVRMCALAGAAIPVYYYFYRDPAGGLPLLGRPVEHFLYLTDFQVAVNMLSLPFAVLSLAGWLVWCGAGAARAAARARMVLALMFLPAICLAGRMNDFMMTRYLMVVIVPMSALCLTALILTPASMLPVRAAGVRNALMVLSGALVIALGLHGRMHLAVLTEYRGLTRFLDQFAGLVRREGGVLLVEYSRLAAPFDHFFGLKTLGIDNERRDDYEPIEDECARMMRMAPDVPVFFMSPFRAPVSDRFVFTPVRSDTLNYRRLRQAGRSLPVEVRDNELRIGLYRMWLSDSLPSGTWDWTRPYVLRIDSSNMGLRRFAARRSGNWDIAGLPMSEYSGVAAKMAENAPADAGVPAELLVVTMGKIQELPVQSGWRSIDLGDDWRVWRGSAADWRHVRTPLSAAFLAGIAYDGHDCFDALPESALARRRMPPMPARWARASAAIVLPRPMTETGRLLMLVRAPVAPGYARIRLELSVAGRPPLVAWSLAPNEWRWIMAPFTGEPGDKEWTPVVLNTSPAWDPALDGFPSDLGVLVGAAVVLP